MPIYNRPVKIVEALSIIMVHAGLFHTAQVAEPAGLPPLWMQLSPDIRHRVIGRTMRAFSLLYRFDIGGSLRDYARLSRRWSRRGRMVRGSIPGSLHFGRRRPSNIPGW